MIHSLIWRPTWLNLETTFCSWFTSMTCIVIHLWAIGWCCVLFKEVNCNRDKSLQCDLNCLFFLSQQWYLPLDISKCKVIRITNDHTCHSLTTSTIANTTLDWVDTFNRDHTVNWHAHSEATATRVFNLVRINLRNLLPTGLEESLSSFGSPSSGVFCVCLDTPPKERHGNTCEGPKQRSIRWICGQ